jgi:hypothetical protein
MLKYVVAIGVGFVLLGGLALAHAQKSTEIFIPIGQSPGLSGEYTKMGEIEAVSSQDRTVTMTDPSGSYTVQIAEGTSIWLDKSKLKLTNEEGSFADLQAGRMVEVKYEDNDPGRAAEWVKVQVTE